MSQKTILLSINTSWNIINFRSGLIHALLDSGYRVVALAPLDAWSSRFANMGVDYFPIEVDQKGLSPRRDLALFLRYRSKLADLRPNVFLGFTAKPNVYGSLAAHSLGIPVINNVSGLGTAFIRNNWLTYVVSMLYRRAFRRSAVVFFQNQDDRNLFISKKLVQAAQARLLPGSGINLDRYQPKLPTPASEAKMSFLLVARILRDKGVGEFVEAARLLKRELPDLSFQLLGPVDAANRTAFTETDVRDWVQEGVVDYLGTANDVRPHIALCDCLVLPSYREGLPRTLLEGAAMAKPLIATDVPGCRDVVTNSRNGFLCRPRDSSSLVNAMRRMAALPADERQRMGRIGRLIVEERFDERLVHRAYLDAISEILATGAETGTGGGLHNAQG